MLGRVGFIGGGKMAEALAGGLIRAGLATPERVIASDVSPERRQALAQKLGVSTTADNAEVTAGAETLVLALQPRHAADVLREVRAQIGPQHLVVSIMAGVATAAIESELAEGVPVVRVMPNTACLVGAAASAVAGGKYAGAAHVQRVLAMFGAVGHAVAVEERLMDAVTGLSGSGPAYAFLVIEALADGGVAEGLPRDVAIALAAQTLLGAGKMALESGEHPAVLRDRVTSPAGTTAEGLGVLEAKAVRDAFAQGVRAATRRSRALGRGES